ncbi:hypothetical protein H696_00196 [Fonticula alba]|uniref:Transcription elongation factor Eaf N-terminal domain-containing protein n=1 Tax=Fonticula alba TaxID=691883 RepID=A0A058ZGJ1_FONAL|nr:hypothetical protein H696_00196 [Fonticula alba]KCV72612.1 hypothetical protein H696_00196 [Fonticula alba]|eukprot:XP_009492313.1 hypothetical protein H696_00196 [Fonticula alba]
MASRGNHTFSSFQLSVGRSLLDGQLTGDTKSLTSIESYSSVDSPTLHLFEFNQIPQTVDATQAGRLRPATGDSSDWHLQFPSTLRGTAPDEAHQKNHLFDGPQCPPAPDDPHGGGGPRYECLFVYDEKTQSLVLERIGSRFRMTSSRQGPFSSLPAQGLAKQPASRRSTQASLSSQQASQGRRSSSAAGAFSSDDDDAGPGAGAFSSCTDDDDEEAGRSQAGHAPAPAPTSSPSVIDGKRPPASDRGRPPAEKRSRFSQTSPHVASSTTPPMRPVASPAVASTRAEAEPTSPAAPAVGFSPDSDDWLSSSPSPSPSSARSPAGRGMSPVRASPAGASLNSGPNAGPNPGPLSIAVGSASGSAPHAPSEAQHRPQSQTPALSASVQGSVAPVAAPPRPTLTASPWAQSVGGGGGGGGARGPVGGVGAGGAGGPGSSGTTTPTTPGCLTPAEFGSSGGSGSDSGRMSGRRAPARTVPRSIGSTSSFYSHVKVASELSTSSPPSGVARNARPGARRTAAPGSGQASPSDDGSDDDSDDDDSDSDDSDDLSSDSE